VEKPLHYQNLKTELSSSEAARVTGETLFRQTSPTDPIKKCQKERTFQNKGFL
jgi:hypothetical protein